MFRYDGFLLNFALYNQVKELTPGFSRYRYPVETLFSAKSNTSLDLTRLDLEPPDHHRDITLGCTSIENFRLFSCYEIRSIKLFGSKLKQVGLCFCHGLGNIHIETPTNLDYLAFF